MTENPTKQSTHPRLRPPVLTTCLLVALLVGCRSETEWKPSERHKIIEVIAAISDTGNDQERLARVFAVEHLPDEAWLKEAESVSFVVDEVDISGDSARVQLTIENHFGEPLQQVSWTCQRTGDAWQVAEAPLK